MLLALELTGKDYEKIQYDASSGGGTTHAHVKLSQEASIQSAPVCCAEIWRHAHKMRKDTSV